jgi:hypothetical protein
LRIKSGIKEYVDDYIKYYPERWVWSLKNSIEQNELYMKTRARRSTDYSRKSNDLLPDFYSIERDANQFEMSYVEWTDFFGLIWEGKKGSFALAGAPDYRGSLYYYDEDETFDESGYCVSEKYDAYENQPPNDIYTKVMCRGINRWIDTANVKDIIYKYVVNNHLFKDTYIKLIYEDGDNITVFSEYKLLIDGLLKHEKEDLVRKVFKSMNEHFSKLRDSEREEIRAFYPGCTAEEMFLGDDK